MLTSLVPQRFYRKGMPKPPPEVPKFSVLIHDLPEGAAPSLWKGLSDQSLPDFEVVFLAEGSEHDPFAGAAEGERRIRFIADLDEAVMASRGEYLVFVDGHSAFSPTLTQNLRKRLDARPTVEALTFGIRTPTGDHTRSEDVDLITQQWGQPLPLALAMRRRPLVRLLDSGVSLSEALAKLRAETWSHSMLPLLALPGDERADASRAFSLHAGVRPRKWRMRSRPVPGRHSGPASGWSKGGSDRQGDAAATEGLG